MGQVYYVDAKLDIKDETEFTKRGRAVFEQPYIAPIDDNAKDTSTHLIETLFAKHQGSYTKNGNDYTSEFDASYGWERVLSDFFSAVKETLNEGSYMTVYPDNGSWTERV